MMTTLGLAFRTFCKVFRDAVFAERVQGWFTEDSPREGTAEAVSGSETRDGALTLLSTLQREARFLDFVMESLDGYDDGQVGAATRDVQRDLASVVQRIFAPQPLAQDSEGSSVEVPSGFDPERFKLTGDISGEAPYRGTLRHHGWKAGHCEMPKWTGGADQRLVLAPSEVEV